MKKAVLFRCAHRGLQLLLWIAGIGVVLYICAILFVYRHFTGTAVFPVECGIVFGTAVRPQFDANGKIVYTGPGPGIMRRVDTAVTLYREAKVKKLFFTGGKGEGMPDSEAEVMRRYAVVKGILSGDIKVEEGSHSTWENLVDTLPMMADCRSIVGISDRYHLGRIDVLSKKAG